MTALEGRALLATLTVNTLADSGAGSLRQLAADASDGDVIRFDSSLTGGRIELTGGPVAVDDAIRIEGPGAAALTIDANGLGGAFTFDEGAGSVAVSGLTIIDGRAERGGAIDSRAERLEVVSVTFVGNTAGDGGAIAQDGGELIVRSSAFLGNRAVADATEFTDPAARDAEGGAILVTGDARATLDGSVFVANRADAVSTARGGAVAAGYLVDLDVQGGTFASNRAVGDTAGVGGAIGFSEFLGSLEDEPGRLTVDGAAFLDNAAEGRTRDDFAGSGLGGAIATSGPTEVVSSLFAGNRAVGSDAGAFGVGGSGQGGALFLRSFVRTVEVGIRSSTFVANQAVGGADGGGGGLGSGGAITDAFLTVATVRVEDSQFLANRAQGGDLIGTSPPLLGGQAGGGAIGSSASELIVARSRFSGNQALGGQGLDGAAGGNAQGGAINAIGDVRLEQTRILGNLARGGSGSTGGSAFGGGVAFGGSSLLVIDGLIALNAAMGGRGTGGPDGEGSGGGIGSFGAAPVLTRSRVILNRASTRGNNVFVAGS